MEVGQLYENRNGQYRVVAIHKGVATIQYNGTNNRADGSVELLERIHRNIQAEREASETHQQVYSQFAKWVEEIHELGFRIHAHMNPEYFPTFEKKYREVTHEIVTEDNTAISMCPSDWKCAAFKVVFPLHASNPCGYKVIVERAEKHITNSDLAWQLIKHGFRIGKNKRK
jgi:hypothetical protein